METVARPSPATATKAPSLKGHWVFGHLPAMRSDPLGLLLRSARECGDISFLRLVYPIHLLAHPAHIERVLVGEHQKNYEKGKLYDRVKPLIGSGLLSSDGDFWLRQRRLAQPAFHRNRLADFGTTMAESAAEMFEGWRLRAKSGEVFDVSTEMMRLTLRVVGLTLMSMDLEKQSSTVARSLPAVLTILNERFQKLLLLNFLPTPQNIRFNRALGALETLVGRIISDRQASGKDGGDLLSMFIAARDDQGQAMNEKQLRDEVMTMLLAGHETTSNALSWSIYLLAKHPDIADKLREEVDTVLGDRSATFADLPKLAYTEMVIKEAMRLYPPVWILGRRVVSDDHVGGYRLAKGSVVFLSPYVTHRHPGIWKDPDSFVPERFSPEQSVGRHKLAYFPFSGGPRACIGDRFAMMEMQIILPALMRRFRFSLAQEDLVVGPDPSVTLRPKGGVPVRIFER